MRIVSENGNLLLIVNLDGKGAMPDDIRTRLYDIGGWLKVNGEAIYGSRPWLVASQGDQIRFTQSKDGRYLYAIHKGWPEKRSSCTICGWILPRKSNCSGPISHSSGKMSLKESMAGEEKW